jgi:hypothetical protein
LLFEIGKLCAVLLCEPMIMVKELAQVGLEHVVERYGCFWVTCCGGPRRQLVPGLKGGEVRFAEEFGAVTGQPAAKCGRRPRVA